MLQSILKPILALSILSGGVALVACGEDDPDPEEARLALCDDYATQQAAVADYEALDDSNTFAEYDAAADRIVAANDALEDSAEDYLVAEEDLTVAYIEAIDDLDEALSDLTEDMTVADAKAAVADEYTAFLAARDALIANADCGA